MANDYYATEILFLFFLVNKEKTELFNVASRRITTKCLVNYCQLLVNAINERG